MIDRISRAAAKRINRLFRRHQSPQFRASYSQSGEDMIVDSVFQLLGINTPSYIDVGAHHPFHLSNTAYFYEKGSRGINIEPDPNLFPAFEKARPKDTNLNIGVGSEQGLSKFYIINPPTLNTFSEEIAESYVREGYRIQEVTEIHVDTLSHIIQEDWNGEFPDFLNCDAEGVDRTVLESIDFQSNFPRVICVETLTFSSDGGGRKTHELIDWIEDRGYMTYADTYVNTIFVHRDTWNRAIKSSR